CLGRHRLGGVQPCSRRTIRNVPSRRVIITDRSDEAKAAAGHGANERLCLSTVADGSPGRIDPAVQRHIRDNASAPDCLHHLVFADDVSAICNEINQQVKNLRLDMDRSVATAQFAALFVEFVAAKAHEHHRPAALKAAYAALRDLNTFGGVGAAITKNHQFPNEKSSVSESRTRWDM